MEQNYIDAVNAKDIILVRVSLADELMLDPRGGTFHEMLSFAEGKIPELFQMDNGKDYPNDSSLWTEEMVMKIKNDLDNNFSKERLGFYEKVCKFVLSAKAKQLDEEETNKQSSVKNESTRTDKKTSSTNPSNGNVGPVSTIIGAVLTVAGICVKNAAVITIGAIGTVAGLSYIIYKKLNK